MARNSKEVSHVEACIMVAWVKVQNLQNSELLKF